MKSSDKGHSKYKQIRGRISLADYTKLESIRKEYGFHSCYEIMQYLLHCFLRSVSQDTKEDEPPEIIEMFDQFSDWQTMRYERPKYKPRGPQARRIDKVE